MVELPTPHGDKLQSLLTNKKLPTTDKPGLESTIERYKDWIEKLKSVRGSSEYVTNSMVALLNEYKLHIDLALVFDSEQDFLYRQKGQLKLDNSVIEEFLPILITTILAEEIRGLGLAFGPTSSFAGLRFEESMTSVRPGAGFTIRSKDQDFAISRKLYLRASHHDDFRDAITKETNVAYIATEIKTNLDKTMFQEAAATSLDVKSIVPGARYYLLCEWLDMTPINTSTTAIDEVLVLRRAKRMSSNVRGEFSSADGRSRNRSTYEAYLNDHPLSTEPFSRYVEHIRGIVAHTAEEEVLARGFF